MGADLAPAGRAAFLGVWNMVMGVAAAGPVAIGTAAQLLGVGVVASLVAALGAAWYAFVATETLQSYPKRWSSRTPRGSSGLRVHQRDVTISENGCEGPFTLSLTSSLHTIDPSEQRDHSGPQL